MKNDIPYRKQKRIDASTFKCEIKHPVYGWIPFTASKHDIEEHGRVIYETLESKE